jgi:hypothetical protein|tara:strand:- start:675 stop:1145 length:471 start_codon:yes stop_codon:yes gene_type:complete
MSSYTLIASVEIATATDYVAFTNLPSSYRDAVIVVDGNSASWSNISLRMNGNTFFQYFQQRLQSYQSTSAHYWLDNQDQARAGWNRNGVTVCHLMDYSSTDKYTTTISHSSNLTDDITTLESSMWKQNAAVTTLEMFTNGNNWTSGTTIFMYGIEA